MHLPQPPTPIQVDNSTAVGISNKSIKQKRSKAMDIRFHWIHDRILQEHFHVFWKPGPTNLGDYHSMHHPQPPTPIQVEKSTAVVIANKSIKQKRSKAMDMRFHWIHDRIIQEHFHVFLKPGQLI